MDILWLLLAGGVFVGISFVVYALGWRTRSETFTETSRERMTIEAEITTRNSSP
jgi:hypothetical protein